MVKSKLLDILKSFSAKELVLFGDFVRSPFFNKNENLVNLYEILKKEYPDFNSEGFTKENIFRKLYPGKKYKDNEIRRNFSEMLKLSGKFLVQTNLSDSDATYNLLLLTELFTRKIDKLFGIKLKEINEHYREYDQIDDLYFKDKYDIEIISKNVNSTNEGSRILFDIDNIFKYLFAYSTIAGLKLSQDINVLRKKMNIEYSDSLIKRYFEKLDLEGFLKVIKSTDSSLYSIIRIYYLRHLIASGFDKNNEFYFELKALVYDNLKYFSRGEKFNIGLFLENSISEKIKEGKSEFLGEAQETNELRIREKIIKFNDNDYLGVNTYRKILETALKLKKTEWAKSFINDNIHDLPPDTIENIRNYSDSILSFASGDHKKALEHISRISKYYDHNFEFVARSVKLKFLFELNYVEDIFYNIDSFRHSLKNISSLPEPSKIQYRNYIKFYEKCIKLKLKEENLNENTEILKNEIIKTEPVLEKAWLLEKLNALSNKTHTAE